MFFKKNNILVIAILFSTHLLLGQKTDSRVLEKFKPNPYINLNSETITLSPGQRILFRTNEGNSGIIEILFVQASGVGMRIVSLNNSFAEPKYNTIRIVNAIDLTGTLKKTKIGKNNLDCFFNEIEGSCSPISKADFFISGLPSSELTVRAGFYNKVFLEPKTILDTVKIRNNIPRNVLDRFDSIRQHRERVAGNIPNVPAGTAIKKLVPNNGAVFKLLSAPAKDIVSGTYVPAYGQGLENYKVYHFVQHGPLILGYSEEMKKLGNTSEFELVNGESILTRIHESWIDSFNGGTMLKLDGKVYVLSNKNYSAHEIIDANIAYNRDCFKKDKSFYIGKWEGVNFKINITDAAINSNVQSILILADQKNINVSFMGYGLIREGNIIDLSWSYLPLRQPTFLNQEPTDTKLYISSDHRIDRLSGSFPAFTMTRNKAENLCGWVDAHTHPMSYLGFGQKAVHGLPDNQSLVPAGALSCNETEYRASSIEEALANCNSSHGGWGTDNSCGNYLRALLLSSDIGIDKDFKYRTSNVHDDHEHEGYPSLKYWPDQTSIMHQQMYVDWLRKAHEGGLRVMVALTVNSELIAKALDGNDLRDDKGVADLQIEETKAFVGRHSGFMEIAESPEDLRRIVGNGRLAVILGMEIDKIGNYNINSNPSRNEVANEIRRLYDNGVRYVFPIHLTDNAFGGAAVYRELFNFANYDANGEYFSITSNTDIDFRLGFSDLIGFFGGVGHGTLDFIGNLVVSPPLLPPFPCGLDGKVKNCNQSQWNFLKGIIPRYPTRQYQLTSGGHVNEKGLSDLGEFAVEEMMRLGMMIDVDHMSQLAVDDLIAIATEEDIRYPLNSGHNSLRGVGDVDHNSERHLRRDQFESIAKLNGIVGIGSANDTVESFIKKYKELLALIEAPIAIGTDVNGWERLPHQSIDGYRDDWYEINGIERIKTGDREWDYTKEGVSHYGLMREFMIDVGNKAPQVKRNLWNSAEYFAKMWEQCEGNASNLD